LSAENLAVPMRLESKSEAADQKTGGAVGCRDPRESARTFGKIARSGKDLTR